VGNISTFISSRLNSTNFICKSTPSYLIVRTHFREQYNLLLTYFYRRMTSVFILTIQLHAIFPLQVIIQNFHPTTSHEYIIAGLLELAGQHVTDIHNLKRFSDKTPLPLFFIDIQKLPITRIYTRLSSSQLKNCCWKTTTTKKFTTMLFRYVSLTDTFGNTITLIHDVKDVEKTTFQISVLSQAVLLLNVLYGIIIATS